MNRNEMLTQLQQTPLWDVVIIGGGATGLGCAVDSASRGYKTLLVEQYDFAKGTSSRSTKLVHGGVRYLAQGNIKLVREALRERAYLLRNAPHVTSTLHFIIPVYSWWDKGFYGVGLTLYNWLAGKLSLGKTRWLGRQKTLSQLPGLNAQKLTGGILYSDGQFDDARLAIDLAKTAVKHGATVLNYAKAESFVKEDQQLRQLSFTDEITGVSYTTEAKTFINATGVFADAVMTWDEPNHDALISPSQGIHLVVDSSFFPSSNALMIPKTDDGRVLFAVPWHNKVLLGTTDTPVPSLAIEPRPLEEEIEFILHHANRYLTKTITRSDVTSVFVGLRPLIKQKGNAATSLLSRDHTILVSPSGLITVSGGKWTTYRKMAEDVINKAIEKGFLSSKTCVTKSLSIATSSPEKNIIAGTELFTKEEIQYFVDEEMAMTVEDILARRTRLLFLDAAKALAAAPFVANEMAWLLQKDTVWIEQQLSSFRLLAQQYSLHELR